MDKLILFHGTSEKIVVPTYGGAKKHDDWLYDMELDLVVQKVGEER